MISAYLQEKNTVAAFSLVQRYPHYASDPQDEEHALSTRLDTGQYQTARHYVERETRSVPWTRYDFGSPTAQPNDRWLTGQSLKLNYLLATKRLPEAEKLSYRLASTAPGNQGLQIDYAALLQARGLPRAAEQANKQRRLNPRIWSLKNSRLTSQWTFRSGVRWIYWLMT